jgi:hypothetical protein
MMGVQRADGSGSRRTRRSVSRRAVWVLLAGAGGAFVAAGCGGSGGSKLDAGETTPASAATAGDRTSSTSVAVTVGTNSTSTSGAPSATTSSSTVPGASNGSTGQPSGGKTTGQTGQSGGGNSNNSGGGAGSPTTRSQNPVPTPVVTPSTTAPRGPQPQSISFPAPGGGAVKYALDRSVPLGATATSNLPIAYAVVDGNCELQGASSVLVLGAGSCTVQASQSGNGDWLAADPIESSFDILNGDSAFTLSAPGSALLTDGSVAVTFENVVGSDDFDVNGSGACSGPGFVSGVGSATVDLLSTGTCTVTVSQSGNQDFNIGQTHTANIEVT